MGPQQPGNDINTYFRPMVEDLKDGTTTGKSRMSTSMSTLVKYVHVVLGVSDC
jgi:hypothetical protein